MVRRAERAPCYQRDAFREFAAYRVYFRCLNGFLERDVRKDSRNAVREHGFSASGRTYHKHGVSARGRDLERALDSFLSLDVGKIDRV